LAIQDTTAVSFASYGEAKRARAGVNRRGLGRLNQGTGLGVLAHVMLAVDAARRVCRGACPGASRGAWLGLVGGAIWPRQGVVDTPEWKRPLAEREARRWVETAEQAQPVLAAASMVTVVSDREGDMYPLWASAPGWRVLCCARRSAARPRVWRWLARGN